MIPREKIVQALREAMHILSRPREQNGEEAMEGLKAKLEKRMAELREMQRKGENDTVVQLAECYWVLKFVNSHRSPSPQGKEMEEAVEKLARMVFDWNMEDATDNPICRGCGGVESHSEGCFVEYAEFLLSRQSQKEGT